MGALVAAVTVGLGLALVAVGILQRLRERHHALAAILDLPYGDHDVAVEGVTEGIGGLEGAIGRAGELLAQLDGKGTLADLLERGRVPMRPGEYILLVGAFSVVAAVLAFAVTSSVVFAPFGALLVAYAGVLWPKHRIAKRRRLFDEQLPDALSLIASSLSAGHTFLRSVQMMCEECPAPLSEEFEQVVAETRLGGSLVDALDHLAARMGLRDLDWVAQAIRVQQSVGGKLGDLLHTLAGFIRARQEVRREVQVLTAEGRLSAWILSGLPVFLLVAIQIMNPLYIRPLFQGWHILLLVGSAAWLVIGTLIIRRLVKIEV